MVGEGADQLGDERMACNGAEGLALIEYVLDLLEPDDVHLAQYLEGVRSVLLLFAAGIGESGEPYSSEGA